MISHRLIDNINRISVWALSWSWHSGNEAWNKLLMRRRGFFRRWKLGSSLGCAELSGWATRRLYCDIIILWEFLTFALFSWMGGPAFLWCGHTDAAAGCMSVAQQQKWHTEYAAPKSWNSVLQWVYVHEWCLFRNSGAAGRIAWRHNPITLGSRNAWSPITFHCTS